MKMGVKEFRERFSDVAEGNERILVTKNGRIVGRYDPLTPANRRPIDWDAIDASLAAFRDAWRLRNVDWREKMASIGLDENGDPLECE